MKVLLQIARFIWQNIRKNILFISFASEWQSLLNQKYILNNFYRMLTISQWLCRLYLQSKREVELFRGLHLSMYKEAHYFHNQKLSAREYYYEDMRISKGGHFHQHKSFHYFLLYQHDYNIFFHLVKR